MSLLRLGVFAILSLLQLVSSVPTGDSNQVISLDGHVIKTKNLIGSGNKGDVYEGTYQEHQGATPQDVAVKVIEGDVEEHEEEARIQKLLGNNDNIVQLKYAGKQGEEKTVMVLDLVRGGDLTGGQARQYFGSSQKNLNERFKSALQGLTKGVDYCHNRPKPIIHHDLKTENILFDTRHPDSSKTIKIADFGFAEELDDHNEKSHGDCGNNLYMAPEFWKFAYTNNHPGYNGAANDVWAMGLIAIELIQQEELNDYASGILDDQMVAKRKQALEQPSGDEETDKADKEEAKTVAKSQRFSDIYHSSTDQARATEIQKNFNMLNKDMCQLLAMVFKPENQRITAAQFASRLANIK